MFSNRRYSFARAVLHGLAVLGLVFAAAASASPAYAAAPTNDLIADAIKITTAAYSGSISDVVPATTSATDPVISCGASQGLDSVWYVFTPVNSGEVSINTLNSQYDTILAVFQNDPLVPGTLLELGCNDNSGASITSALSLTLRGGIRYYIEVVRKTGTAVSSPDRLNISYVFSPKVVAWSDPLGKKWDGSKTSLFTYSAGWQSYPVLGAMNGQIQVANNVNNTATAYFDGGHFDLTYALRPDMGNLEVYVDNILQVTLGQNAPFAYPQVWSSPAYSDGVHKLTLKHTVGLTKANFDYIKVYSFPDITAPARILTLTAATGTSTGKVTLKWTAVGDDGNVGTATGYKIMYFVDTGVPINCWAAWATGTPYTVGLPVPTSAGTAQQITLSGLVPGLNYYFCIAAVDDVGNMGIPSNPASAIATAGVPYGTGTYDDNHVGWSYTGNWELVSNPDARYNTLHVSKKIDDAASFYFTGDQFVFTYRTSYIGGLMDVYIDGIHVTTIDQYTYFPNSFSYTSPILAYGPHFVRFIHVTPVHATRVQVTVDQIYVWRSFDGGSPDPIVDLAAVPGVNDGEVDLTWTATGDDPFGVGTAHHYEIRYSSSPINNLVDWDYAVPASGVFPPPQAAGNIEAMTVVGLPPSGAYYYFAVRSFDDAYYDVLSNTVYTGDFAGSGFYEDNDPIWSYNAASPYVWLQINDVNASAGHYHRINSLNTGSLAMFWFTGRRFQVFFQKDSFYGSVDVYVDGVKVGTFSQYHSVVVWNQTWTSPVFAAGNHVVEFRVVGKRANIDRIKIIP